MYIGATGQLVRDAIAATVISKKFRNTSRFANELDCLIEFCVGVPENSRDRLGRLMPKRRANALVLNLEQQVHEVHAVVGAIDTPSDVLE
jgi:hypothetical protein